MLADLCALVAPPGSDGKTPVLFGYDLITERSIEGDSLNNDLLPLLFTGLQRGLPLRLPGSSTSTDLAEICRSLKIDKCGSLLAAPIIGLEEKSQIGILLLSPYSNRGWSSEDETHLTNIARAIDHLLRHAGVIKSLEINLAEARQTSQEIREQAEQDHRTVTDIGAAGMLGSIGEFGWAGAASTYYWIDPAEELAGVFMTQYQGMDEPDKAFRVLAYQSIVD